MPLRYLGAVWAKSLCVLVLFCLALSLSAPASADDSVEARVRSLALFKESAVHYEAGRYSVAAALLEEAYVLHPEPKLLYNLGRAREAGREVKGAVEAYEAYLRAEPESAKRDEVQGRLDQLKADSALSPAPAAGEPSASAPEGTQAAYDEAQAPSPPTEARSPGRTVPWILVGSGGGLLGAALTVGILARAGHQEAKQESVQVEAAKLQSAAERKALVANLLAGAGGALLIAGGAWLIFGGRSESGKRGGRNGELAWWVHLGASNVDWTLSF